MLELKHGTTNAAAVRVNLGCGGAWNVAGWFGIDQRSTAGTLQDSRNAHFIDIDVRKGLPFPTSSVDVVFSSHTLEHFTRAEAAVLLDEIHRVLKVGAPFCVVVPDLDRYLGALARRDNAFLEVPQIIGGRPSGNLTDNFLMNFYSDPRGKSASHKYSYNFENLKFTLELLGFEGVEQVDFHQFSYWPELEGEAFRSPIPQIDRFSLCVQGRKAARPANAPAIAYVEDMRTAAQVGQSHTGGMATRELERCASDLAEARAALQSERQRSVAAETRAERTVRLLDEAHASLDQARRELEATQREILDLKLRMVGEADGRRQNELAIYKSSTRQTDARTAGLLNELQSMSSRLVYKDAELAAARASLTSLQVPIWSERRRLEAAKQAEMSAIRTSLANFQATLWSEITQAGRSEARSSWSGIARPRPPVAPERSPYVELALSGLFDPIYYLASNPEVSEARFDPLKHFLDHGASEGRSPNPLFDTAWYRATYPDVQANGLNPLIHYHLHGEAKGFKPSEHFDPKAHAALFPELAGNPVGALAHALRHSEYRTQSIRDELAQSGAFDGDWYLEENGDVRAAGIDPLLHYLTVGAAQGRNPNDIFDTVWYLKNNPDVAGNGVNPLLHYLRWGEREGRRPAADFHPHEYAALYPQLREEGVSPLAHAIRYRAADGLKVAETVTEIVSPVHLSKVAREAGFAVYTPLISIILPTHNSKPRFLREAIESIRQQTYENWELCIIDDGSSFAPCLDLLRDFEGCDPRIRVVFSGTNKGIAGSTQAGVDMARGEFVAFIDHDDIAGQSALAASVELLRNDPSIDYIYTDHAMIDEIGQFLHASLKPGWSPEFLLSTNYIVHFKVIRKAKIMEIGGFRAETSVIQDLDLSLRLLEAKAKIRHLPKVLYFWREHSLSVASGTAAKPAIEALAIKAYNAHFKRRGLAITTEWPQGFRQRRLGIYRLTFPEPKARSAALIVLAAGSSDLNLDTLPTAMNLPLAGWTQSLHVVHVGGRARAAATQRGATVHWAADQTALDAILAGIDAEFFVFARASTRFMSPQWLRELIGYLELSHEIGAVGGKVLDENLCVRAGGFITVDQPNVIGAGESDRYDGHWFSGKAASNVEAVSASLMATRKDVLLSAGGLPVFDFADAAGVAYGLALRRSGLRIVYNPWCKAVDSAPMKEPADLVQRLKLRFGDEAQIDRYYNPGLSRTTPFVMARPEKRAS